MSAADHNPLHRARAWWRSRRLAERVGIVLGVIAAAFSIPVATTQVVFEDAGASGAVPAQQRPDQATRTELARRFAPILRLDQWELFDPIDARAYLGASDLNSLRQKAVALVKPKPSFDELTRDRPCLALVPACRLFLDVVGVNPPRASELDYDRIENGLFERGARRVVYSHVTQYRDSGEYAVQYWFLYFFNYRLNQHESDWEQITVRLDEDKRPLEAFYSSHASGQKRLWARMEKGRNHPVDYVARGSHANYFTRGTHSVTIACAPLLQRLRVCVRKRIVLDLADGARELRHGRDYELAELPDAGFRGGWGSGNFVARIRTKDIVSDPRLRRAWLDPLGPFARAKLVAKL
jgi:hypothetical protein